MPDRARGKWEVAASFGQGERAKADFVPLPCPPSSVTIVQVTELSKNDGNFRQGRGNRANFKISSRKRGESIVGSLCPRLAAGACPWVLLSSHSLISYDNLCRATSVELFIHFRVSFLKLDLFFLLLLLPIETAESLMIFLGAEGKRRLTPGLICEAANAARLAPSPLYLESPFPLFRTLDSLWLEREQ